MAMTGVQKAATLLLSIDSSAAAELIKGLSTEDIEMLGIELARMQAAGSVGKAQMKVIQEFIDTLQQADMQVANIKSFLNETLVGALGQQQADRLLQKIEQATRNNDPFARIRAAQPEQLLAALVGEHPQTIAVVLGELAPQKSQQVLSNLEEDVRKKVVCRMAADEPLPAVVRDKIAVTVTGKLAAEPGQRVAPIPARREEALRKLAVVLSGLEKDARNQLLEEIKKKDEQACAMVRNLMVTWQDIPLIADRSLQEALRSVEPKLLATALFGADEQIAEKIKNNISERAVAALEEEASLMQEPMPKEIADAREQIVKPLREANEEGKLRFVGR